MNSLLPHGGQDQFPLVLLEVLATWNIVRVSSEIHRLHSFFADSKIIIYSDHYLHELVDHCDEFNYDAYVLRSDKPDDLSQAIRAIFEGKFFLSRSIIGQYCRNLRRQCLGGN